MSFELYLVDPNMALVMTWRAYFADAPRVTVLNGRFQDVAAFDCLVSPANSFGLMDANVDSTIVGYFGEQLSVRIHEHIIQHYFGEQPVGTAFIVPTDHDQHRWLVHTPTMRVPMDISRTDNVYLAMFAMLRAVHHHNASGVGLIRRVVCPGLGTGAGRVPAKEAARQMELAYRNFLNPPRYITWDYARQRQTDVRYGGTIGENIPPVG